MSRLGYSLHERLTELAEAAGEACAYTFLRDGEYDEESVTFGELRMRAGWIARGLRDYAGQPVVLALPPGNDYIAALFGCFYAGAIAVPSYPPLNTRMLPRALAIVQDCSAVAVVTTAEVMRVCGVNRGAGAAKWLTVAELLAAGEGKAVAPPTVQPLAFLQYTSGSTANPKGVRVTHANIHANHEMIRHAAGLGTDTVFVNWLPPYHDMGLIGNLLNAVHLGVRCVHFSPFRFVEKPLRWLRAIERHGGTMSGGPNFAYDLCLEKIPEAERATLNLASWQVAFNGAEPVRHDTLARFTTAFAASGFPAHAWLPCYGLAEATLMVSGRRGPFRTVGARAAALREGRFEPEEAEGPGTTRLVSCGPPTRGQEVAVVEPARSVLVEDGVVGEIWIRGPNVCTGYWRETPELRMASRGLLAGRGEFLRTGDLGLMLDGELFPAGRIKEVLIVNGRKYFPADIEASVQACSPDFRRSGGAAVVVSDSTGDRMIVVQELRARIKAVPIGLPGVVRQAIFEEHQVSLHDVWFVRAGAVPRTSSGKIQRVRVREMIEQGAFERLPPDMLGNDKSSALKPDDHPMVALWRTALSADAVDLDTGFFAAGGTSLAALGLVGEINRTCGVAISLPELMSHDSPAKMAAFLATDAVRRTGDGESPFLPRAAPAVDYPLSNAQQRIWVVSQTPGGSLAYQIGVELRLVGRLQRDSLEYAFRRLMHRHESLRTSIITRDGDARQWVTLADDVPFDCVDLSGETEPVRAMDGEWRRQMRTEMDLAAAPLWRARLCRLADNEWSLVVVLHHLIGDGWSVGVLLRELFSIYNADRAGVVPPLKPLARQYRDYAVWQRERALTSAGAAARAYWHRQLEGELPAIELPLDRPRPAEKSHRGGSVATAWRGPELEAVRRLAQRHEVSLFIVLLAAAKVCLFRHTAAEDMIVGVPLAGRDLPELREQVGVFAETVAIRSRLRPGDSFQALLSQLKQALADATVHAAYPFDRLVRELQLRPAAGRHPVFDVMVEFNPPLGELALDGLTVEPVIRPAMFSKVDLCFVFRLIGDRLTLQLEHDADLFQAETMDRWLEAYRRIVQEVVIAPAQLLRAIDVVGSVQRRLLSGFNATAADLPLERCIHELFEAQVERQPDAIAAVCGEQTLSFARLADRSNAVARRLASLGVRPEDRVGLRLVRSFELLAGVLGILKAGAAYVPIDPEDPPQRARFVLEDSGCRALLTHRAVTPLAETTVPVVNLDDPLSAEEAEGGALPAAGPRNLAYVIYTSGSTGQPKGCMLEHRGVVNRLAWMADEYGVGPGAVLLQKTRYTFDVSVWEILLGPVTGATVCLLEAGGEKDPAEIARAMIRHRVTVVHFVPTMLNVFLQALGPGAFFPDWRHCICSGEALRPEDRDLFFRTLCGVRLHNLYGPTEASIDVTFCEIVAEATRIPIGRPVANTSIHILDAAWQPVPVGVFGELCVGGVQVGRGYLNRPGLTGERFVAHELAGRGRLYRTGDLGRWLPDGTIEYAGRIDAQIKVRGFRVEPVEVEDALRRFSGIDDAVVVLHAAGAGDPALCAFYVSAAPVEVEAIRRHLLGCLPAYMVPARFFRLAALPLTSSGKVDRRRLFVVGAEDRVEPAGWEPPRGPLEERIAAVFSTVLGAAKVGRRDNFFLLGGDSIRAVRAVIKLREDFGLHFTLPQFVAAPQVTALAAIARSQPASPAAVVDPAGEEASVTTRQPCISPIDRVMPRLLRTLLWAAARLSFQWFLRLDVRGLEHLRALDAGVIFAPNHTSELDPVLVSVALPFWSRHAPLYYVSRDKHAYRNAGPVKRHIYGSRIFRWLGAHAVCSRFEAYEKWLAPHLELLRRGENLLICPEGVVSKTGLPGPARGGVVFLAEQTCRPVVPVAIHGAHRLTLCPVLARRHRIVVEFLPALSLADLEPGDRSGCDDEVGYAARAERILDRIRCAQSASLPLRVEPSATKPDRG